VASPAYFHNTPINLFEMVPKLGLEMESQLAEGRPLTPAPELRKARTPFHAC
jgi:hypothetical protein